MQKLRECLIILKTQIEKDLARRPQDPFLRGEIHGLTLALYEVQKALSERSTAGNCD